MKRTLLEEHLGKNVRITLYGKCVAEGELHKTQEAEFDGDPNLYLPVNYYFCVEPGTRCCKSVLFRCSHVKSVTEVL